MWTNERGKVCRKYSSPKSSLALGTYGNLEGERAFERAFSVPRWPSFSTDSQHHSTSEEGPCHKESTSHVIAVVPPKRKSRFKTVVLNVKKLPWKWIAVATIFLVFCLVLLSYTNSEFYGKKMISELEEPHSLKYYHSVILQQNLKLQNFSRQLQMLSENVKSLERMRRMDWFVAPNGYKYKFVRLYKSWLRARHICHQLGGDLAQHGIRDMEVNQTIKSFFQIPESAEMWIGLNDIEMHGVWRWNARYPSNNGEIASSSNVSWAENQPSNDTGTNHCAYVFASNMLFYNQDCEANLSPLCEKAVDRRAVDS